MGLPFSAEKIRGWSQLYLSLADWPDRIRDCLQGPHRRRDELTFYLCFFAQAYSIRDWLAKQKILSPDLLDAAIAGDDAMRICRDVCNRYKHYVITKPSIDADFSIHRGHVVGSDDEWHWMVMAGDHHIHLWDLMVRCINFWEALVAAYGLHVDERTLIDM